MPFLYPKYVSLYFAVNFVRFIVKVYIMFLVVAVSRGWRKFSQYSRDLLREYLPVPSKDKHRRVLILASKINENKMRSTKVKDVRSSFGEVQLDL